MIPRLSIIAQVYIYIYIYIQGYCETLTTEVNVTSYWKTYEKLIIF